MNIGRTIHDVNSGATGIFVRSVVEDDDDDLDRVGEGDGDGAGAGDGSGEGEGSGDGSGEGLFFIIAIASCIWIISLVSAQMSTVTPVM